jgi:dTDP-glucose pyrophosphorylase
MLIFIRSPDMPLFTLSESSPASLRKGLIPAGGCHKRLHLLTGAVSAQMLTRLRDAPVISTPQSMHRPKRLLKDVHPPGMGLGYWVGPSPDGLAQAFSIFRKFVCNRNSALIPGDTVADGHKFADDCDADAHRWQRHSPAFRQERQGFRTRVSWPICTK